MLVLAIKLSLSTVAREHQEFGQTRLDENFCCRESPPADSMVTSFKNLMLNDEKSGAKPKQPSLIHSTGPPVSGRGDCRYVVVNYLLRCQQGSWLWILFTLSHNVHHKKIRVWKIPIMYWLSKHWMSMSQELDSPTYQCVPNQVIL